MNLRKRAKLIWDFYKIHLGKSLEARSGFQRCGVYPEKGHMNACRAESLAEHTDGVLTLLMATASLAPEFFSKQDIGDWMCMVLIHDAPEIVRGDVADNGDRDDAVKDADELKTMEDFLSKWPSGERESLIGLYLDFQNHRGKAAQVAYCMDKLDAPLRALGYELSGVTGAVSRDPQMSQMDEDYACRIGSYDMADVWSYHVLDRTCGCYGTELLYAVLSAAYREVRGYVPFWLDQRYHELYDRMV